MKIIAIITFTILFLFLLFLVYLYVVFDKVTNKYRKMNKDLESKINNNYHQLIENYFKQFTNITRVEVIDKNGRSYSNWNDENNVSISFQDENRTLKIFITKND